MTTRLPFLAGVLILTLALIAIVEIVLRTYPVDASLGELAASNITRRVVFENVEDKNIGMIDLQYGNLKERETSTDVTLSNPSLSPIDSIPDRTTTPIILFTPTTSTTTSPGGRGIPSAGRSMPTPR